MKMEAFFEAVGEIDERFIADAHTFEQRPARRLRSVLLIAACIALLGALTGGVFAATRWFRMTNPAGIVADPQAYGEAQKHAKNEIVIENTKTANYVGFQLNEAGLSDEYARYDMTLWEELQGYSLTAEASASPEALKETLVHYRAESADGETLIVRVMERSLIGYYSYFTRYDTTVIREGTLNSMDVVWLQVENPTFGTLRCLFCRNSGMNCTLMISSNRSFEKAEKAAQSLTLVDSGVPIPQNSSQIVWCFRAPTTPESVETETRFTLEHTMKDWTLKDPDAEVESLVTFVYYSWKTEQSNLFIQVREMGYQFEDNEAYVPVKTGTVNGHAAAWYDKLGPNGKTVRKALVLTFKEDRQTLVLDVSASRAELQPELLEILASQIELVAVEFIDPPSREFSGLAAGDKRRLEV